MAQIGIVGIKEETKGDSRSTESLPLRYEDSIIETKNDKETHLDLVQSNLDEPLDSMEISKDNSLMTNDIQHSSMAN